MLSLLVSSTTTIIIVLIITITIMIKRMAKIFLITHRMATGATAIVSSKMSHLEIDVDDLHKSIL